jgi:hypothetical protein
VDAIASFLVDNFEADRSSLQVQRIVKRNIDVPLYSSFKVKCIDVTLASALRPEIWPSGVIVREFVHFSRIWKSRNLDG